MDRRTKSGGSQSSSERAAAYQSALDNCAVVAREEFHVAMAALGEVRELAREVSASVDAIAGKGNLDGEVVGDARKRLGELKDKLDAQVFASLKGTSDALKMKSAALDRFTVTLFGRTMAGKSTIREALTHGDGSTIGKGAQRTTRDVREYEWHSLRIIDTPGIGAYEGDEDRLRALKVIDTTDLVLFLTSSDGIQEEAFKGMQALREQNKPILFVLNVKRDLQKAVFMRRFLADPASVFGGDEIRGHVDRIQTLAGGFLGMREIRVIPIHAQAAYLATRPEHEDVAEALVEHSHLGHLLAEIESEVLNRGRVRRVQTILDGTVISLLDIQQELREQAKTIKRSATYFKDKFQELDVWFDGFIKAINGQVAAETALFFTPLRDSVSAFVDENIEQEDVGTRWDTKVKTLHIEAWLDRQQATIMDELRGRLNEFSREVQIESKLFGSFNASGPKSADPFDVKRTLGWVAAGSSAVAGIAFLIGGANFWNPVGWIATGVGLVAGFLAWLSGDRETKLQIHKSKAAEQLRDNIDRLEQRVAGSLKKWFYENITSRLARGIRTDTRQLYNGMFEIARALEAGAQRVGEIVERLNCRLIVRTGQFVGAPIHESRISRVVRDPGVRAKFMWTNVAHDGRFCVAVGKAIGERIDGIVAGTVEYQVAEALRPAMVAPGAVSVSGSSAMVKVPQSELGRAIGKGGGNVSLASRLTGLRIKVIGGSSHG